MQPTAATTDRFAYIIANLVKVVAARIDNPFNRQRFAGKVLAGLLIRQIAGRLQRIHTRFAITAAQIQAGTLKPSASRKPRSRVSAPPTRRAPDPAKPPLPTGFAWLLRLVSGHEVATLRGYFLQFLWEPKTIALVEAAPQLGRTLRGFCRMLGIKLKAGVVPPALLLPKRPKQPQAEPTPPLPPLQAPLETTREGRHAREARHEGAAAAPARQSSDAPQPADALPDRLDPDILQAHLQRLFKTYGDLSQVPNDELYPPGYVPQSERKPRP